MEVICSVTETVETNSRCWYCVCVCVCVCVSVCECVCVCYRAAGWSPPGWWRCSWCPLEAGWRLCSASGRKHSPTPSASSGERAQCRTALGTRHHYIYNETSCVHVTVDDVTEQGSHRWWLPAVWSPEVLNCPGLLCWPDSASSEDLLQPPPLLIGRLHSGRQLETLHTEPPSCWRTDGHRPRDRRC